MDLRFVKRFAFEFARVLLILFGIIFGASILLVLSIKYPALGLLALLIAMAAGIALIATDEHQRTVSISEKKKDKP